MNSSERRRYPRHETEIEVTVHKNGEEIPATLIDISQGGIGLISGRGFFPGTEVDITFDSGDDYAIHGTVRRAQLLSKEGSHQYRVGVEADQILIMGDIMDAGFPERSDFIKKLLS
jgi:c-di-GMP-binding flagellar brake protein YcgR